MRKGGFGFWVFLSPPGGSREFLEVEISPRRLPREGTSSELSWGTKPSNRIQTLYSDRTKCSVRCHNELGQNFRASHTYPCGSLGSTTTSNEPESHHPLTTFLRLGSAVGNTKFGPKQGSRDRSKPRGSKDREVNELSEEGNIHSMVCADCQVENEPDTPAPREHRTFQVNAPHPRTCRLETLQDQKLVYFEGRRTDGSAYNAHDAYTVMYGTVLLMYEIQRGIIGLVSGTGVAFGYGEVIPFIQSPRLIPYIVVHSLATNLGEPLQTLSSSNNSKSMLAFPQFHKKHHILGVLVGLPLSRQSWSVARLLKKVRLCMKLMLPYMQKSNTAGGAIEDPQLQEIFSSSVELHIVKEEDPGHRSLDVHVHVHAPTCFCRILDLALCGVPKLLGEEAILGEHLAGGHSERANSWTAIMVHLSPVTAPRIASIHERAQVRLFTTSTVFVGFELCMHHQRIIGAR
ncbi:hypothetical protein VNO77_14768 [Canavalia gladiata]|uniref:Uncharacterized protein n=1 Tax=Canavalia gladiata TaxID=3824 RepID=A0AAN9M244_CANGL